MNETNNTVNKPDVNFLRLFYEHLMSNSTKAEYEYKLLVLSITDSMLYQMVSAGQITDGESKFIQDYRTYCASDFVKDIINNAKNLGILKW